MREVLAYFPELKGEELFMIREYLQDLTKEQKEMFAEVYRNQRRDPQMLLIGGLLGFAGIGGVERLLVGQIGMGVLYLLTGGLCLIGTIIDLVNHKELALEYNHKVAERTLAMVEYDELRGNSNNYALD